MALIIPEEDKDKTFCITSPMAGQLHVMNMICVDCEELRCKTPAIAVYILGLLVMTNIVCLSRHLMLIPRITTKCVSIADRDEHNAEFARVKSPLRYFFQSCRKSHWVLDDVSATSSNSRWIKGSHHVLEEVASRW